MHHRRPAERHVYCSAGVAGAGAAGGAHARPAAVAMLLYRECLMRRSNTVALSNGELRKLGISR